MKIHEIKIYFRFLLTLLILGFALGEWSCGNSNSSPTPAPQTPSIQVTNSSSYAVTMSVTSGGQAAISAAGTYTFNPHASGNLYFVGTSGAVQNSSLVCPGQGCTVISSSLSPGQSYSVSITNGGSVPATYCGGISGTMPLINWNAP